MIMMEAAEGSERAQTFMAIRVKWAESPYFTVTLSRASTVRFALREGHEEILSSDRSSWLCLSHHHCGGFALQGIAVREQSHQRKNFLRVLRGFVCFVEREAHSRQRKAPGESCAKLGRTSRVV
jgi:hypothetical protein